MMGGGMMIEGSKTGEEKLVSAVERRVSTAPSSNAPLDNGIERPPPAAVNRDALRLKKLEAELRKVQELLKKRTGEKEDAERKAQDFEELLSSTTRRLSEREMALQQELRQKQLLIDQARAAAAELEQKLRRYEEEQAAQADGSRANADRHNEELRNLRVQMETLRKDMQHQVDRLKADAKHMQDSNTALQRSLQDANAAAASREQTMERERSSMQADCAKLAADAEILREELRQRDRTLDEWRSNIDQCRHYIVKICQPQFAVVKDESLVPVAAGQDGGFVLVPLHLMLEGYTLLPGDMKKKIAEEYESNKKMPTAGRTAVPDDGELCDGPRRGTLRAGRR